MRPGIDTHTYSILERLPSARFVGTWDHDVTNDGVVFDGGAAEIMTGDRDLAGRQITLEQALLTLHHSDRKWVLPKIEAVAEVGGDLIADYRVQTPNGVRLLLDRGKLIKNDDGSTCGFGILIDITDVNYDEIIESSSRPDPRGRPPLSIFEDLQKNLNQHESFRVRVILDMLRRELGRSGSR